MVKRLLFAATALLATLALGGGGAFWWLTKRAEPVYSGEVALPGLAAPVRVRFGPHAVPSIQADSLHDLLFAQGYLIAGERMWQMDLLRRLADGRLAEVLGADALDADRLFRTLGLNSAARRALAELTAPERGLLAAYADGVNAYRAQAADRLPIEYLIAGFTPAPWRPEDSLLIGAYMAFTQSFNLKEELTYLRMAQRVGKERARELFPTDEGVPAPPVAPELPDRPLSGTGVTAMALARLLDLPARFGLPVPAPASNAWAVTGAHTANSAAMLANDPHLAPSVPGIWYELELGGPDLHVAGLALPGVPLILIGHNADLAWGMTSAIADTQDLFLERLTADGEHVERADRAPEAIRTRVQQIEVKGAPPVEFAVRSTSHGVILNDLLAPGHAAGMPGAEPGWLPALASPYLIALRQATDLPDRSLPALWALARARTLAAARTAGLDFYMVSQNLMLAHRDGGIAWQVTGLLPHRGQGAGTFPAPGWVAGYGWDGPVPQERNPTLTDPPEAMIVTANNRTIPPDADVAIGHSWLAPYRAQRIAERLAAAGPLDPAGMAAIQSDRLSIQARLTQRALRRIEPQLRAADPAAWTIAERDLLPWDGVMDGSSRAAALYALLEPALWRAIYGDELGEDLAPLMSMATLSYNSLQETLRTGESSFWDDVTTAGPESPAQIWGRALRAAAADLDSALPRPADQRLDRLHTLVFPHAFHRLPLLGRLFDVGPTGIGGAAETVDLAKPSSTDPRQVLIVPSARVVQTPADWRLTRGTLPLGQSGHRFSPYRTDQFDDWCHGRGHPWPWNGPPTEQTKGLLVLQPVL